MTEFQNTAITAPKPGRRSLLRWNRSGADLGSAPILIGLALVWIIFTLINPIFLSSRNLVVLLTQLVPVGVIGLGVVVILLVAQIDLSVGSMSGLSAATTALLIVNANLPAWVGILAALAVGALVGLVYGALYNRFGVPSFVATLGGLLALLGVQLSLLGAAGTINVPFNSFLGQFGNAMYLPQWLAYVAVVAYAASRYVLQTRDRARRAAAKVLARSPMSAAYQNIAIVVLGTGAIAYLYQDRGVSAMFVVLLVLTLALEYLLRSTRWGRYIFAVGGNPEAARRTGIRIERVYLSAFVVCSVLAALGGVLFAAYNVSASDQTGTGTINLDAIAAPMIGGTSLFGGRGSARSALLGMLVIQSITNGLALISPSPNLLFIVTGLVLLVAISIDSVARRGRAQSGAL